MRTRLSVCRRKAAYPTEDAALAAARASGLALRTYRCDRCQRIHLTSRTKGKRIPRPVGSQPIAAAEQKKARRSGGAPGLVRAGLTGLD